MLIAINNEIYLTVLRQPQMTVISNVTGCSTAANPQIKIELFVWKMATSRRGCLNKNRILNRILVQGTLGCCAQLSFYRTKVDHSCILILVL